MSDLIILIIAVAVNLVIVAFVVQSNSRQIKRIVRLLREKFGEDL